MNKNNISKKKLTDKQFQKKWKNMFKNAPPIFRLIFEFSQQDARYWKKYGEKIEQEEGHEVFWPIDFYKK